jgi:hypothetical protein
MSSDALPAPPAPTLRLTPIASRYAPHFCMILLLGASALASFIFACATPFATFAVIAAGLLPLRPALVVMAAAWLVNQAIGFAVLGYPLDATTIQWGFVIGAAALAATVAATAVLRVTRWAASPVALSLALGGACAAYELVLFAGTPFLGGAGNFTAMIIGRLAVLSLLWLVALVTACDVFDVLAASERREIPS